MRAVGQGVLATAPDVQLEKLLRLFGFVGREHQRRGPRAEHVTLPGVLAEAALQRPVLRPFQHSLVFVAAGADGLESLRRQPAQLAQGRHVVPLQISVENSAAQCALVIVLL